MKKHTRIFAVIMAVTMLFSMTACGGNANAPETTEVPTEAPTTETVSVCEANGHTWANATCDTAKICSVCGETVGEALGHSWADANYQAPKTCTVCNATEGEPLVAAYVEHGMDARLLDMSGEYDFTNHCGSDATKLTTGKLTVESYGTFASDEAHEALDGYEWKVLTVKIRFSDENAQQYGMAGMRHLLDDYYYSGEAKEIPEGEESDLFEVDWNGMNYTECTSAVSEEWGSWESDGNGGYYIDYTLTFTYRIPVGYDGVVVGLSDATMEWPIGSHLYDVIDDTARLFRLN